MQTVAERLREFRESLDISQADVNRYEHGETVINANALRKYADFFDVSADYILGRCDDPRGMKFGYQPEF